VKPFVLIDLTMKMRQFFLTFTLVCALSFPVNAEESRADLKKLIAESVRRDGKWGGYPAPSFSPHEVRKRFYGDEAAFLGEIAALLHTQSEEDKWTAQTFIMFLDIDNETILKIVREQFASVSLPLQLRFCTILSRHLCKDNIVFLANIAKQSNYHVVVRVSAIGCLSTIEHFEGMDAELQKSILDVLLSNLENEDEFIDKDSSINYSDRVLFSLGHLGSFAKPALPKIKERFGSIQEPASAVFARSKLDMALSIVRIVPEECNDELDHIIQRAVKDESEEVRWLAICYLSMTPPALAGKVIPSLCAIIQKESCIESKIRAAESIKAILLQQQSLIDPFESEYEDETEAAL